jgi:putative hydrolase of the HAD superfamily
MIKAVLFDLFETLITESGTRPPGTSSRAADLGCDRAAFRAQWKAVRPAVMTGRVPFRHALADIATRLGSHAEEATLQRIGDERSRARAESFAQLEPQILMMLAALRRRGLRLGVISNCCREDVAAWPESPLASRFDCTMFSFEVGLAKPDPAIYAEAARRLRCDVSDVWFIGDGADGELSGAEQAGLRAFRAEWFLRRWPHFRDEPASSAGLASVDYFVRLVEHSMKLSERR